jgi:hypothetical protein
MKTVPQPTPASGAKDTVAEMAEMAEKANME